LHHFLYIHISVKIFSPGFVKITTATVPESRFSVSDQQVVYDLSTTGAECSFPRYSPTTARNTGLDSRRTKRSPIRTDSASAQCTQFGCQGRTTRGWCSRTARRMAWARHRRTSASSSGRAPNSVRVHAVKQRGLRQRRMQRRHANTGTAQFLPERIGEGGDRMHGRRIRSEIG